MKLRQIAVSEENYHELKSLGKAGDSFNDVISEMLKEQKLPQASQKVAHPVEPAIVQAKTTRRERSDS